jgi:hypothetical protein
MTSIKSDIFKSNRGSFERLNNDNYPQWADSMSRTLKAEELWEITTGEETCSVDADAEAIKKHRNRQREAGALLHNACSVSVRVHIGKEEDPKKIWDTLKIRLDSAASDHGRQTLKTKLYSTKPAAGESISIWFEKLLLIRDQLAGSTEEVDDALLKSVILNNIPSVYETTLKIEISRGKDTSIEAIMDAVKEDESRRTLRNQPPAATDAFYARDVRDSRNNNRYDPRQFNNRSNNNNIRRWCGYCNSSTHNYAVCYRRPRDNYDNRGYNSRDNYDNQGSNSSYKRPFEPVTCYHCGEEGHRSVECPVKKKGDDARYKRVRYDLPRITATSDSSHTDSSNGNAAISIIKDNNHSPDKDAGPGL